MDRKDEIILQQLETIRTMAENNLNRMGMDFRGNPTASKKENDRQKKGNECVNHKIFP